MAASRGTFAGCSATVVGQVATDAITGASDNTESYNCQTFNERFHLHGRLSEVFGALSSLQRVLTDVGSNRIAGDPVKSLHTSEAEMVTSLPSLMQARRDVLKVACRLVQ